MDASSSLSLSVTSHNSLSPPKTGEYAAADAARQRLYPKRRLLASLPNLRASASSKFKSKRKEGVDEDDQGNEVQASTDHLLSALDTGDEMNSYIILDDSAIPDGLEDMDIYKWAVVYENQRGLTVFSTAYYSSLSLLPTDPLPFTLPSASKSRSAQPSLSLSCYPLPDGKWRWVSKSWMIDMRSDCGEVQYDGFEYNWRFRQEGWRAEVGSMGSGGLVRRRRWMRLMMRPGKRKKGLVLGDERDKAHSVPSSVAPSVIDHGLGSTESINAGSFSLPPSVMHPSSEMEREVFELEADDVWKGSDVEMDWHRCHLLMRRLGRDGRKLDLWKRWLGLDSGQQVHKGKQRQWTEDSEPFASEAANQMPTNVNGGADCPPLEHIAAVLRIHGDDLLHSFIYPDSRAEFLKILGNAELLPELNVGLGIGWEASEVDFWSYERVSG